MDAPSTIKSRNMTFAGFCMNGDEGLYQLRPEADQAEILEQLDTRLTQLSAMLTIVYGNGGETFRVWNDDIQDNFLWACQMLALECKDLAGHLKPSRE